MGRLFKLSSREQQPDLTPKSETKISIFLKTSLTFLKGTGLKEHLNKYFRYLNAPNLFGFLMVGILNAIPKTNFLFGFRIAKNGG